jgi:hypothetical protein
MYREVKKLNSQRISDPVKKQAHELNVTFLRQEQKWPKNT